MAADLVETAAAVRRAGRSTSATATSRRRASGRSSSSAARSSPCPPRRATSATSPRPPAPTSARPPGRPTASRSPTSPTPSGEYELHVRPQDGKGEPKAYPLDGAGFYERPVWSPDSKKIAFIDNSRTLYCDRPRTRGKVHARSPPSRSTARSTRLQLRVVARLEVAGLHARQQGRLPDVYAVLARRDDKSTPLTDGLAEVGEPVFDAGGQVPVLPRLDRRRAGEAVVRPVQRRHAGDLRRSTWPCSPRARRTRCSRRATRRARREARTTSDEEGGRQGQGRGRRRGEGQATTTEAGRRRSTSTASAGRVVALPIPAGQPVELAAGDGGAASTTSPRRADPRPAARPSPGTPALHRFDLKTREEETLAEKRRRIPALGRPQEAALPRPRRPAASSTPASSRPARARLPIDVDLGADRAARPSGRRSSTRPGGSTATTSTPPTCTAPTGRRSARSTQPFLPDLADPRRPEPRHPLDVQRAGRRPQLPRRRRPALRAQDGARSACSGPTTRSTTAAIASRRSTAA